MWGDLNMFKDLIVPSIDLVPFLATDKENMMVILNLLGLIEKIHLIELAAIFSLFDLDQALYTWFLWVYGS